MIIDQTHHLDKEHLTTIDLDTIAHIKIMKYVKVIEIMVQDPIMIEVVIQEIVTAVVSVAVNGIALKEPIQYK